MTEREDAYLRVAKAMHEHARRLAPPLGAVDTPPPWDALAPAAQELTVAVVAALEQDATIVILVDPVDAMEAAGLATTVDPADVEVRNQRIADAEARVEQARRAAWHEDEQL